MEKRKCVVIKDTMFIPSGTEGVATYPVNSYGNVMFYPENKKNGYCSCLKEEWIEWK